MKRVFLVMFVSALLVTFGFAQTPAAGSNTDPANVKGCLGGSDGNYTVVEDGTGQIFKITSSTVDLKAHVGHGVKLAGHKASATDNSFSVNELSMISEHCAAAAAAAGATVTPSPETVITPDPAAAAPASATPAAPASATPAAPAVDAAAPAATVAASPATASAPPVETAPAAAVTPAEPVASTPPVAAVPPTTTVSPAAPAGTPAVIVERPALRSTHARQPSAKKAVAAAAPDSAVSPPSDTVIPTAADTAAPAGAGTPSAATAPPPVDATAPAPVPTVVTHRTGSLALLIGFVVLVIVFGTTAPLIGRWRKRKLLERDGAPNLSFTNDANTNEVDAVEARPKEAASDPGNSKPRKVA